MMVMDETVKYNSFEHVPTSWNAGDDDDWYILPAPKFGKKFKPIFIKQTGYDEGEGYAPVSLYEIDFLDIAEWDIFDDWSKERGYYGLSNFTHRVLEKFYGLVKKNDPKIKDYVIENGTSEL